MGFLDVLGTIASPVASLVSGGLGLAQSSLNLGQQKDLMKMNNEFQSAENQRNRDWQSAEWTRQFDLTNAYNDPRNIVSRLTNAGLNPAQVMAGGSASAITSHATPSSPSGGVTASPSPDYSGILTSGFQSMNSIADMIKKLAEAKKVGKESGFVEPLMNAQINELIARMNDEQAKADLTNLQKKFEEVFGVQKWSKTLDNLTADYFVKLADAKKLEAEGKYFDESTLLQAAKRLTEYVEQNLGEKKARLLDVELKFAAPRIQSEIERNKGQAAAGYGSAAAGYASANLQNAQAITVNLSRGDKMRILGAQADVLGLDRDAKIEYKKDYLNSLFASWQRNSIITDVEYQRLRQLTYDADNQALDRWMNRIGKVIGYAKDIQDFSTDYIDDVRMLTPFLLK